MLNGHSEDKFFWNVVQFRRTISGYDYRQNIKVSSFAFPTKLLAKLQKWNKYFKIMKDVLWSLKGAKLIVVYSYLSLTWAYHTHDEKWMFLIIFELFLLFLTICACVCWSKYTTVNMYIPPFFFHTVASWLFWCNFFIFRLGGGGEASLIENCQKKFYSHTNW